MSNYEYDAAVKNEIINYLLMNNNWLSEEELLNLSKGLAWFIAIIKLKRIKLIKYWLFIEMNMGKVTLKSTHT